MNVRSVSVLVSVLLLVGLVLAFTAFAEAPEDEMPDIPFLDAWMGSGHADAEAEAFTHWDEDDPPVVEVDCAKCHSSTGYLDFLGADGFSAGAVDEAPPVGTVVTCITCHNLAAMALDSVQMPSGVVLTGLGSEARCMLCHQGRAAKASVDDRIAAAGLTDMDTVSEDMGFTNIHYFAAAATQYGTAAQGGYQYDGKAYDSKFEHVEGYDTCVHCHSPHTLEVKVDQCAECHFGVTTVDDLKDLRSAGSMVDYDGDGDIEEGVYYEIEGLQELLYEAIQAYASEVAGTPIVYSPISYPYFFIDTNEDGDTGEDEAVWENSYNAWTGRLAKAAYNYQTSLKDPGAFAHGGKYVVQLLYDSIEDLNPALSTPVDLSSAHRIDHGHFAGSEEAFRHWDGEEDEGIVPASCSRCHTGAGLPLFLKEGVTISQPASNGLMCTTCHESLATLALYPVETVEFPSGAVLSADARSNLCMNCHQGRQSTVSVDRTLAGTDEDTVSEDLGFLNVHYFAAGATRFGTDAKGAYEYDGKKYEGPFVHVEGYDGCTGCHAAHTLMVKVEECMACHVDVESAEDISTINMSFTDFDGDGDNEEGMASEIAGMHEALLDAIQDYAADIAGTPIAYESHTYPYFFVDTNADGLADSEEAVYPNGYASWTPRLLKAAYNYQYAAKDPGAYAHNGKYVLQTLYDSLESLGEQVTVNMDGMLRPEVSATETREAESA